MGVGSLAGVATAGIVGSSAACVRLKADIARIALYSSNVLITGESGTGKELVARQIHAQGRRASQPFVPVDCASMTGELMASQLFGHVPGAFTGANTAALGCVRAANRGTLFLDEIGELDYALQAKLLRVLQERVVTPVGTHRGERVDVQVIAATNRNLQDEVRGGRFREDLYYRLNVIHLRTPPLRQRAEDIPDLASAMLAQLASEGLPCCRLSVAAEQCLMAYAWPGNVRQLRNILEQAAIDADGSVLGADLFRRLLADDCEEGPRSPAFGVAGDGDATRSEREPPGEENDAPAAVHEPLWSSLAAVERQHLLLTLEHTFFNRTAAARLLGITRQALLRKMERHDIRPPRKPGA
ncbi:MAG TPA: sigma-54 dependent transcriptional regulator [Lacipirellula sp.]